ncbi:MAG: hypothetical protein ACREBU_16260 [Nitrososphaera sp.]
MTKEEITSSGSTIMKKFLKPCSSLFTVFLIFCHGGYSNAENSDPQYVSELHPPVVASDSGSEIIVLFTKNNMKKNIHDSHVANGEIFYVSSRPFSAKLNYVWKVEDEEISSVFFYEWKAPSRAGKSLFLLTRRALSNSSFSGHTFSVTEFPLIKENNVLSLNFFPGDHEDSTLTNCLDGRDLANKKTIVCPYKDAGSIKKYLTSQDH